MVTLSHLSDELSTKKGFELKRLKAIEDISNVCADIFTSDFSTFSHKVLKPFCKLTGADYGLIVLLRKPEDQICVKATYGFSEEFSNKYNKCNFRINTKDVSKDWPSIKCMNEKKIVLVNDTNHLNVGFSRFFNEAIRPNQIRAVASVPIIINNRPVGTITKYYTKPHTFTEEDISFMRTTTNIISSTAERNLLLEVATCSEKELAETNTELKYVNKELDSFVYVASHDLREPLRTIESFISILEERLLDKLEPDDKDYFSRIVRATQRMRKLIQDLTNLSRASRGATTCKDTVDLNNILMATQFELTAFINDKNAKIISKNQLPKVRAHKESIASIFKNLISNGIKFNSSEQPTIEVSTEEDPDPNRIRLIFADNGIGVDAKYHEKIFNLFQRLHTQDEYEGTGAGLSIVKKILDNYNCNIYIESEPGEGSKFIINLPKVQCD